jgi:DNA (cytosine-5)-methyltransferase 1
MGLIVDNFAGGGGASTGIEMALGRSVDIAINHDPEALTMHAANHPMTKHYIEDIWQINPVEVTRGEPVDLVWFSPDCKHFSKAKGGKPCDKKIRGLAWVAVKWAQQVRPTVICLENVEEFQDWGPLADSGQPIKAYRGQTFDLFLSALREQGYYIEHRELSACDYGAPTTRKRFFLVARCDGFPVVWPEKTHGFSRLPYRTAGECIDWSIPCPSIFDRSKPLVENTMRRIAKGIIRYVLNNPKPFIVDLGSIASSYPYFKGQETGSPFKPAMPANRRALTVPHITKFHNNTVGHGIDVPLHTITASSVGESNHPAGASSFGLVTAHLSAYNRDMRSDDSRRTRIEKSVVMQSAGNHRAIAEAFLAKHYGGIVGSPLDAPLGTVTGIDHHSLVAATLVKNNFGEFPYQDVSDPLHTITTQSNKFTLVAAFLSKYYNAGVGENLDDPIQTIVSKDHFGFVCVRIDGEPYTVVDIGMRMLQPRELFRAQGFPDSYVIDPVVRGKKLSKSSQIRMVGNSVCPPVAAAIVKSNMEITLQEKAS